MCIHTYVSPTYKHSQNQRKRVPSYVHPIIVPPPLSSLFSQKMGAKLVGGLHKPNDQTSILPSALLPFLRPLPIRSLPGVGHHLEAVLKGVGVERVEQMQALSLSALHTT